MTKTIKRRFCRIDGCDKIVKSQGLCQRHGAKTRMCKMENCSKQAQGNFDGMCKVSRIYNNVVSSHSSSSHLLSQSHFKESRVDLKETIDILPSTDPPPPSGQSVYDVVIPASLSFQPNGEELMPLVAHLKEGFDENRPRGWHRNDERRARGLWPVTKAAMQLQGWERELVWMEICILSGSNQASFRHLARAWGRDKGFHMVLAQFICERRGNVERKSRPKGGPKSQEEDEEIMDDILSFEDMELPIEVLDAMRNEHASEGQQYGDDSSEEEAMQSIKLDIQSRHDQLQAQHAAMTYSHAWDAPKHHAAAHHQETMHEQVLAEQQSGVPIQHGEIHSHEVPQQMTEPRMVHGQNVDGQEVQDVVAHEAVANQEAQQQVPQDESNDDDDFVDPLDLHLLMPHANDANEHEPLQQQPVQDPEATHAL